MELELRRIKDKQYTTPDSIKLNKLFNIITLLKLLILEHFNAHMLILRNVRSLKVLDWLCWLCWINWVLIS